MAARLTHSFYFTLLLRSISQSMPTFLHNSRSYICKQQFKTIITVPRYRRKNPLQTSRVYWWWLLHSSCASQKRTENVRQPVKSKRGRNVEGQTPSKCRWQRQKPWQTPAPASLLAWLPYFRVLLKSSLGQKERIEVADCNGFFIYGIYL
jgi:hypothetical protein